jgi:hypothetical protein
MGGWLGGWDVSQGQAIWRASQSRLDVARRLVSEMRVQVGVCVFV